MGLTIQSCEKDSPRCPKDLLEIQQWKTQEQKREPDRSSHSIGLKFQPNSGTNTENQTPDCFNRQFPGTLRPRPGPRSDSPDKQEQPISCMLETSVSLSMSPMDTQQKGWTFSFYWSVSQTTRFSLLKLLHRIQFSHPQARLTHLHGLLPSGHGPKSFAESASITTEVYEPLGGLIS